MTFGGPFSGNWPGRRGKSKLSEQRVRSGTPKTKLSPPERRASQPSKTVVSQPVPSVKPPVNAPVRVKLKQSNPLPEPSLKGPRIGPEVQFSGRRGIAIVGKFDTWRWGQHPDEAYLADALQILGYPVYRVQEKDWDVPVMEAEWVLFTGPTAKKLGRWAPTHKTIVWTLDWLPDHPERQYIVEAGKHATYFVTSDRYDWLGRSGIDHHVYLPAACETIDIKFAPQPTRPVAFLGSIYNERRRRIAELVRSLGGQVLDASSSWIYGAKLARFCQETKIIIGDNIVNDCPSYWSSRNYVIPGSGGFLLTPLVPELDEQFHLGKDIAVYTSLHDLKTTAAYYLRNDAEREKIRKKSFEHVRTHHNWGERAVTLLEKMGVKIKK